MAGLGSSSWLCSPIPYSHLVLRGQMCQDWGLQCKFFFIMVFFLFLAHFYSIIKSPLSRFRQTSNTILFHFSWLYSFSSLLLMSWGWRLNLKSYFKIGACLRQWRLAVHWSVIYRFYIIGSILVRLTLLPSGIWCASFGLIPHGVQFYSSSFSLRNA